jgi:NADPH2 dehydrogenase
MSLLFEPLTLRGITLKNRIAMSSMLLYIADKDGKANDFHFAHYAARALGGVGLIMVEVAAVEKRGRISLKDLGLWNDEQIEGLKRISAFVQSCGAKAGIQLAHAGRKAKIDGSIIAPSALPYDTSSEVPLELTKEDIKEIVQFYKEAAIRAEKSGFDLIELHAAHGYLIHEFLSPISNKRNDEYGGSYENRSRFLIEIIQEVRSVWPEEKPLNVRFSAKDYTDEGFTIEEGLKLAHTIKSLGVDLLDVSAGNIVPGEDIEIYPGYQTKYSELLKKEVGMPTGTVGSLTSSEQIEEILRMGKADLIFMGRELLRNPFWVWETAKKLNIEYEPPISIYSRATGPYERGF